MANKRDYYEVLGVDRNATPQQIKSAYRKLAKEYHPDRNKAADAEAKFKEVQEAYDVLSDQNKKATYDQFGHAGMDGAGGFGGAGGFDFGGGFGGFEDIFGSFFGGRDRGFGGQRHTGPMRGNDRFMSMTIDFMEAMQGAKKTFTLNVDAECDHCHGSGAETPNDVSTCSTCNGSGRVMSQQRTPFGIFQSESVCPDCQGKGKKVTKTCHQCHGQGYETKKMEVDVTIPKGINTGQQLRVSNKGERGVNGGPNGDLYIEINVRPHNTFVRDGQNIYMSVPISVVDATLGTKLDIPTIHGDVTLNIPEGTQPNQKFKLKGKGVPVINTNNFGDQIVEVKVEIDKSLSKEERNLYQQLKDTPNKKESPFERFKRAFRG